MFRHLLPVLEIGGTGVQKSSDDYGKQSFVDDRFDLDNAIQTKAEFFYAIAVG